MNNIPLDQPEENAPLTLTRKDYEAPCIETVLTPEEMAREVLYAGRPSNF